MILVAPVKKLIPSHIALESDNKLELKLQVMGGAVELEFFS